MSANDSFHIAVLGGDGIGPEVMAPALEVLRKVESKAGVKFRFTDAAAGKVGELIREEQNPNLKLRVFVSGGGATAFMVFRKRRKAWRGTALARGHDAPQNAFQHE